MPARARHLWRQTDRMACCCGPCHGAYQPIPAGRRETRRNGSADFEETDMKKNGFALAALALFATLAHADDYLSPTEERVRLSLGVDPPLERHRPAARQQRRACRVRRSTRRTSWAWTRTTTTPSFKPWCACGNGTGCGSIISPWIAPAQTTITEPIIFRDVVLQPGDPVLRPSIAHLRHHLRILVPPYREVRGRGRPSASPTPTSPRARASAPRRGTWIRSEDQAGPFPTVGLDATYVISKRFYVDGRAQYLKVSDRQSRRLAGLSTRSMRCTGCVRTCPSRWATRCVRANLDSRQTTQGGILRLQLQGSRVLRQSRVLAC